MWGWRGVEKQTENAFRSWLVVVFLRNLLCFEKSEPFRTPNVG